MGTWESFGERFTPAQESEWADAIRHRLLVRVRKHQRLADQSRPPWYGLFGDAARHQFHHAAVMANKAMVQRLGDPPWCDAACIARVDKLSQRYELCITRRTELEDYARPCILPTDAFTFTE